MKIYTTYELIGGPGDGGRTRMEDGPRPVYFFVEGKAECWTFVGAPGRHEYWPYLQLLDGSDTITVCKYSRTLKVGDTKPVPA